MKSCQFTDQLGREISVNFPPRRIISLVPSQTELLFDLGLGEKIVGITKFCIHPHSKFKTTTKIGGTKTLNLQKIRELQPDLIIGNKEENEQKQAEALMNEYPVWMSDINTLADALSMITDIGTLTGESDKAGSIVKSISDSFDSLKGIIHRRRAVVYFIWKDPYMIAGKNTFINDILNRAGFENVADSSRYPELSAEQIRDLQPELILLSSEPYPFKDVHVEEMKRICPAAEIRVVDGEMFSWYGSRLVQTPSYLQKLNHDLNQIL